MARRLRLHFATRRSNTDPLSESCSHEVEDGLGTPAQSPAEPLTHPSSFHMKVTPGQLALGLPPLSPDYGSLQRHTTVFVPKVNSSSGNRKSILQISLQSSSKQNLDAEGCGGAGEETDGICDGSAGGSTDGGSCSSSTSSDVGYCSSSSIFESDVAERKMSHDKGACRQRTKAPLRRCSSLVIFPRSPCTTPPASPVSPVAAPLLPPSTRGPFQTSHQLQLSATDASQDDPKVSVASAVNGVRLSKSTVQSNEVRDAKPILHFSVSVDSTIRSEQPERHSSVLVHSANQPPLPPGKGNTARTVVNIDCSKSSEKSEEANTKLGNRNPKLCRSTSACMLPTGKLATEKRHHTCPTISKSNASQQICFLRGLQRSISLEVPFLNTGISCHMSNTKQLSCRNGEAYVHIHVCPGNGVKVTNLPKDFNAGDEKEQALTNSGVSILILRGEKVIHEGSYFFHEANIRFQNLSLSFSVFYCWGGWS